MVSLYKDAVNALAGMNKMATYEVQERILKNLLRDYPDHKVAAAVDAKVKLLNLFYSTGIQATSKMTEHILGIKNIDKRLTNGDKTLVPEIAELTLSTGVRTNYSFATKYCALHQPDKFPIYDSIVASAICSLFKQNYLPPFKYVSRRSGNEQEYTQQEFLDKLHDYDFYVTVYDLFMKLYDLQKLGYRKVDWYVWGAYKQNGEKYKIEELAPISESKYHQYEKSASK